MYNKTGLLCLISPFYYPFFALSFGHTERRCPDGRTENKDRFIPAGTAEDPQQINTIVNRDYTLKNAASKVEYRMTCTTLDWADGMGEANPSNLGIKSDGKKANPVLRIAGKSSTGGAPEIDHNTWIAIVK